MAKPARTIAFAHLLGFGSKPAAAAAAPAPAAPRVDGGKDDDSDERKKRDGESDEDYAKRMDALDAKKAKAAKTDSDKDEPDDGEGKEKAKAAAMTERARCAAIMAHGINHGCVRQAGVYAFDTDLAADVAIATIDATIKDREANASAAATTASPSLAMRMARESVPPVANEGGAEPSLEGPAAIIAMAQAAMAKAQGKA